MNYAKGRYYTNYEADGEQYKNQYCFAEFFDQEYDDSKVHKFKVFIPKQPDIGTDNRINCTLLFNEKEIVKHVNVLKLIIPSLKFSVYSDTVPLSIGNTPCYVVEFTMQDCHLACKYALTWVRYLYEWPYNAILKEAYRLKSVKGFKKYSIANLDILCATAFPLTVGVGHSLTAGGHFLTNQELKRKVHTEERLNDVYKNFGWEELDNYSLKMDNLDDCRTTDYWDDEAKFKSRIEHYKHILSFLTKK